MAVPRPPRPLRSALALTALGAALLAPGATGATAATGGAPAAVTGWDHERPAPGVDLYHGTVGAPGAGRWTVTVTRDGAHLGDRRGAETLAAELDAAGFDARTERVSWPRGADREGLLGVRVRVGAFDGEEAAEALRAELAAAGFEAVTDWTGGDGTRGTGHTRVHVAVIDPERFTGALGAGYGEAVAGRESLTAMAADRRALLAVNGGYFVMEDKDGVPGAAAGVAAYDGELQASATAGRVAAVLRGDGARAELRHLRTSSRVRAGDASAVVDGVNRRPGLIRNCGGTGGDVPTQKPLHDVTCTDPDELVQFTDELGAATPGGDGVEAVVGADGTVEALRARGGPVPAGGSVLAGTGEGAAWLRQHAVPGTRVDVRHRITDGSGRTVRLGKRDDVVGGGPRLVRDGRVDVGFGPDGTDHADDPGFAYAWALKRNPRTLLGVDGHGRLLLVAAEGRQPGHSDGLGVVEAARLMDRLGAVEAMNLDGGGSTGMALDGKLLTKPSDATGERAVGDALFLTR
jgi:hypothetical protein